MTYLTPHDALVVVDVQRDFLPGGALGIQDGDRIVPILTRYVARFHARGLPIFITRDWHPPDHCSFQGARRALAGPLYRRIARLLAATELPASVSAVTIYKAIDQDKEAYSTLQDTPLDRHLRALKGPPPVHRGVGDRLLCAEHGEGCAGSRLRCVRAHGWDQGRQSPPRRRPARRRSDGAGRRHSRLPGAIGRMNITSDALLTDLYELTMAQAYLAQGMTDIAVFEFFVRETAAATPTSSWPQDWSRF